MTGQAVGHHSGLPTAVGRPVLMGVVNVTPDSFSDGGYWFEPAAAIAHGRALAAEGADLVDVGGESTRPGAERPSVQEELRRVLPVVEALGDEDVMVSVDTMRAEVAAQALDAGATIVNDVSGGLADPDMVPLVAERGCPYVAMHWRGPQHPDAEPRRSTTTSSRRYAPSSPTAATRILAGGVAPEHLVLDPGLGFAKHAPHNWALLAAPRRPARPRPAGPRRCVAQDLPRPDRACPTAQTRARPPTVTSATAVTSVGLRRRRCLGRPGPRRRRARGTRSRSLPRRWRPHR